MKNKNDFEFNSIFINKYNPNDKEIVTGEKSLTYHYTSPEGLLNILDGKAVLFSDISYFNDKSENVYIVKCILDFLDNNPKKYMTLRNAFDGIIKSDRDKIRKLEITNIEYNVPLGYKSPRKFVFCTSREADSLCMCINYIIIMLKNYQIKMHSL